MASSSANVLKNEHRASQAVRVVAKGGVGGLEKEEHRASQAVRVVAKGGGGLEKEEHRASQAGLVKMD
jgi:hypothetical protein